MPKETAAQKKKVKRVMEEHKRGTLKSGKNGKGGAVKSRKQAIAIAMHEAGIPKKKTAAKKPAGGRKSSTAKKRTPKGRQ